PGGAAPAGVGGGGGVAGLAGAAAGGACPGFLRRPDRSAGRLGHGDPPGHGAQPPGPGGGAAAGGAGGREVRTPSEDRDWPGAAPRVPGEGDVEEALRRALRAAADGVEPAGDGLAQIFRRVAAPWLMRQVWLLATDCADLLRL